MEQVTLREFKNRISFYLDNLPITITRNGEIAAVVSGVHNVVTKVITETEFQPNPVESIEENKCATDVPQDKMSLARELLAVAEDGASHLGLGGSPVKVKRVKFKYGPREWEFDNCCEVPSLYEVWNEGNQMEVNCRKCKKNHLNMRS